MAVLTEGEIEGALASLEGWSSGGDHLFRDLQFDNFKAAVAFVVRVAFEAEAAKHHPDLDIRWNKVRVMLSTHSEGGVTAKDVDLARTIQQLA